jgi:hypothetical protein
VKVSILSSAYRGLSAATHMSIVNTMGVLGWQHRVLSDDALLDHARGMLVTDWYLHSNDDVFVMVDDDIAFLPADVLQLVNRNVDMVSATYPSRLGQTLTGMPLDPGMDASVFEGTELIELARAGMGCIAIRREVITRIVGVMEDCYAENGHAFWPFFLPFVRDRKYTGEDMAFCARVRETGSHIWLDPQVRVAHMSGELPVTMANMNLVRLAVEAYQSSLRRTAAAA